VVEDVNDVASLDPLVVSDMFEFGFCVFTHATSSVKLNTLDDSFIKRVFTKECSYQSGEYLMEAILRTLRSSCSDLPTISLADRNNRALPLHPFFVDLLSLPLHLPMVGKLPSGALLYRMNT